MRGVLALIFVAIWASSISVVAEQPEEPVEVETEEWQRIDSRYCTIWIDPALKAESVNRRISVWQIQPVVKVLPGAGVEEELAAKFDTIFWKAQELLDMYPPGIHVTIRVAKEQEKIGAVHHARYGFGTSAVAFYVFENNTVYAVGRELSESVLVHEMAHCIMDHYFAVRPPRKVEEMLAIYTDEHLRD